MYIISCVLLGN